MNNEAVTLAAELAVVREELRRVKEDQRALAARVQQLEVGHQEHTTELDEVRQRLGALQSGVDRLMGKATEQGLTLERQTALTERQTEMTEKVYSLPEQLVRQQTPLVEVRHG